MLVETCDAKVEVEILGMKSSSLKMVGSTGQQLLFLQAIHIVDDLNVAHCTSVYFLTNLLKAFLLKYPQQFHHTVLSMYMKTDQKHQHQEVGVYVWYEVVGKREWCCVHE